MVKNNVGARLGEIDFLKAVCIVLMVMFHLVYFGDMYPTAKDIVYTFHMPIFLLISGYLCNVGRSAVKFLKGMWWIFVPYAIMEIGYVVMSSFLPVRGGVEDLSLGIVAEKLLLDPLGPYWYLHTLIISSTAYFCCFKALRKFNLATRFTLLATVLYIISNILCVMELSSAMYFFFGALIKNSKVGFKGIFQASGLALIPLVWLCCYTKNLNRANLSGIAITFLMITLLLYCYKFIPHKALQKINYIGKNTLPILLFSPIFTMIAKFTVPYFAFEPTGILFALSATTLALCGSFAIGLCSDKLSISRYIVGRNFMQ